MPFLNTSIETEIHKHKTQFTVHKTGKKRLNLAIQNREKNNNNTRKANA